MPVDVNSKGISRRGFLGAAAAGLGAFSLRGLGWAADPGEPVRPPNFVIIFCDDLGYQDLGCFGSPKIKTPRLDRMAAEGMRFTDFYVSASVCTPSRASLMTGCYASRVSLPAVLGPGAKVGISGKETTIAELLKARGYATACVGKWHLGHLPPFLPTRHGFDSYFGIPYSNDMKPTPLLRNEETIEEPAKQDTLTQRYTEEAVKFIAANKDRPFFLYLPHSMPHTPIHCSAAFRGKSARGLYGDVVEEIDWSVGRVLDALKEAGVDDRTCVVFSSDNGPWLIRGEHGGSALPLRNGKGTLWEGGFRVPCIMRWPGTIPAGAVCSELAATIDILPTFARLAGAVVPADRVIDGKDIGPLITGQAAAASAGAKTPHEAYYYFQGYRVGAVRSADWKLMLPGKAAGGKKDAPEPGPQLFNLQKDIGEKNNVAEAHADVVKRLTEMAGAFQAEVEKNRRPCGTA